MEERCHAADLPSSLCCRDPRHKQISMTQNVDKIGKHPTSGYFRFRLSCPSAQADSPGSYPLDLVRCDVHRDDLYLEGSTIIFLWVHLGADAPMNRGFRLLSCVSVLRSRPPASEVQLRTRHGRSWESLAGRQPSTSQMPTHCDVI